jgi:hypothetical protein
MQNNKEHTGIIKGNSIFLSILFVLILLVSQNSGSNSFDRDHNSPAPAETKLMQSSEAVCTVMQIQLLHKSWIANKDNFRLLTFNKAQFKYNKKVDQKIILLENLRKNTFRHSLAFFIYHLLPHEKDELPVLS